MGMIYKISYTIENEDYSPTFFTDRQQAKENFIRRCYDLGVDKGTWDTSSCGKWIEHWDAKEFKVGKKEFWLCVGVKAEKIPTGDLQKIGA